MSTGNTDELVENFGGLPSSATLSLFDPATQRLYTSIFLLLKIYPVLILVLGTFGNLLSFCVLIRAAMRRYSTFCYLACLALVDLAVIITFCVNFISLYHFNYDIQNESFPCKLFAFCIYFLPQYSSWILVAVSIDRVISAKYLRLAKTWTKPRHSVLVTFILGLFFAVLNSHFFLYDNQSIKQKNQQQTNTDNRPQRILHNDTALENFLSAKTFAHHHVSLSFMDTFSDSSSNHIVIGNNPGDSSLAYESFTPPPAQSLNGETTIQDPFDNSITINQNTLPPFDINVIQCSLENSKELENLYVYWAWIDLAMNVFIPFTGTIRSCSFFCIIIIIIVCLFLSYDRLYNNYYSNACSFVESSWFNISTSFTSSSKYICDVNHCQSCFH